MPFYRLANNKIQIKNSRMFLLENLCMIGSFSGVYFCYRKATGLGDELAELPKRLEEKAKREISLCQPDMQELTKLIIETKRYC